MARARCWWGTTSTWRTGCAGRSARAAATRTSWRAPTDGVRFTTVATVGKDAFGAESLERPALVVTADGRWRLYVSVATPGTKHWRVDLLEADTPEGLAAAAPRTVMPGSDRLAVKDPVVVRHDGRWHAWASCHPLDDPEATDRMTTEYATSDDGVTGPGTAPRSPAGPGSGTPAASGSAPSGSTDHGRWPGTTAGPPPSRTGRSGPAWPRRRPRPAARAGRRAGRRLAVRARRAALRQRRRPAPTAAPGSTSRSPGRTAPTTCARCSSGTPDAAPRLLRRRRPQGGHHRAARRARAAPAAVHVAGQGAQALPHRRAAADGRRPGRREDLPRVRLAARGLRGAVRRAPEGTLRGESTPFYLHDHEAQQRHPGRRPGRPDDRAAARPGRPGALELDPPVVGRPGARGRLPAGLRPGGAAGRPGAGRRSGGTSSSAGTASSCSGCTRWRRGSRCSCCATGTCASARSRPWT